MRRRFLRIALLPTYANFMLTISSVTDIGLVRDNNEDCHKIDIEHGLAIVADGVGAYLGGDVASELAVMACYDYLMLEPDLTDLKNVEPALVEGLKFANQQVMNHKLRNPELKKMGTTLTCLHLSPGLVQYAWIGDSRIYRLNPDTELVEQLSRDHTVYEQLRMRGQQPSPNSRHVLTRMVGNSHVRPDSGCAQLAEGDIVLACSDGLSDMLTDARLLQLVTEHQQDLSGCLRHLVEKAKGQGGRDNITAVLARLR